MTIKPCTKIVIDAANLIMTIEGLKNTTAKESR